MWTLHVVRSTKECNKSDQPSAAGIQTRCCCSLRQWSNSSSGSSVFVVIWLRLVSVAEKIYVVIHDFMNTSRLISTATKCALHFTLICLAHFSLVWFVFRLSQGNSMRARGRKVRERESECAIEGAKKQIDDRRKPQVSVSTYTFGCIPHPGRLFALLEYCVMATPIPDLFRSLSRPVATIIKIYIHFDRNHSK